MSDAELEQELPDICASYQQAVIDQLRGKTRHLLSDKRYNSLGLSGACRITRPYVVLWKTWGAAIGCPV